MTEDTLIQVLQRAIKHKRQEIYNTDNLWSIGYKDGLEWVLHLLNMGKKKND